MRALEKVVILLPANLVNDELASVFANRRRRRRSATPVKIGGIVMGDENGEPNTEQSVLFQPFAILKVFKKNIV